MFSQPDTERKHSLVSRMLERWRPEFHGFDLGKGLRFYLLAESLDFSSLCVRSASQRELANQGQSQSVEAAVTGTPGQYKEEKLVLVLRSKIKVSLACRWLSVLRVFV